MAYFFGKSGADAIAKALDRICLVLQKYSLKLDAAISAAQASDIITSEQATIARTFISTARTACDIFKLVARNSGF